MKKTSDLHRKVGLLLAGILVGALIAPASANAALSIASIWNKIKPKTDARYVRIIHQASAQVDGNPASWIQVHGFSALSNPQTGVYCLTPGPGLSPSSHVAVASPEHGYSSGSDLRVSVQQPSSYCAASQFEVLTYNGGVLSNGTAFTIQVI